MRQLSKAQMMGLRIGFAGIGSLMLLLTIRASLVRSVLDNGHLMPDVWFQATLADAYFAFFAVITWICFQESTLTRRLIWTVLVLILGSMAIAAYVILWTSRRSIAGQKDIM